MTAHPVEAREVRASTSERHAQFVVRRRPALNQD